LLKHIVRGLILASGTMVLVAGALALAPGRQKRRSAGVRATPDCKNRPPEQRAPSTGREYFRITRARSKSGTPQWVLEGFGRYQCFLFFDTWQQAMEQATFRLESLGTETTELIRIAL
jgi:hypothetical protein